MEQAERLRDWLGLAADPDRRLIYKRLSANDTGATTSHQSGFYIPARFALLIAPELEFDGRESRQLRSFTLVSHDQWYQPNLRYYASKHEAHLTSFGGRQSPLQQPDSTGAVFLCSFSADGWTAEAWLATTRDEEELLEGEFGLVEPGVIAYRGPDEDQQLTLLERIGDRLRCHPTERDIPRAWREAFPSPLEIANEAIRRIRLRAATVDRDLLARHECEYALFQVAERIHVMPSLEQAFPSVDQFIALAQSVLQRRKSRAGRSLELQLTAAFVECGVSFDSQATTEDGHRPDFVFPSIERYRRAEPGATDIAVLAAKSTLRDRWRQVLREADKVTTKHLLTLDRGVSENQFNAMAREGIVLVVPADLVKKYPRSVRGRLMTISAFIATVRGLPFSAATP